MIESWRRHAAAGMAIAAMVSLAGCANLADVQDFAKASHAVVASEPIIASWPGAYATAKRRAGRLDTLTALCKLPPDDMRSAIRAEMDMAAQDADTAVKTAAVLALYMDMLGKLAGDDLTDTSEQRTALQASIATVASAPEKAAAGALLAVLDVAIDGWRRHKIAALVKQADPSVQVLTHYLARTTKAVAAAEAAGARLGDAYWERSGCNADEGTRSLLLERAAAEDAVAGLLEERAALAAKLYAKIGKDHAAMAAATGKLSGTEVRAILKRDVPVLNDALKAFQGSSTS